MNYKEFAQQYGVLPPEEKKLYCTKCGAPKHGGECATTIGPPLWFDEADTASLRAWFIEGFEAAGAKLPPDVGWHARKAPT